MRLLFAGTPQVAVFSLDALVNSAHEVVGVLTRPPARAGRGRQQTHSPVHQRALDLGLPVFTPSHVDDPAFVQTLRELQLDCAPVVAFGALLPESVLDVPVHGWVNLHFSLLPRWRGAAPVQAAIMHGDAITGATTFRIDAGLDTGPTFAAITETLDGTETTGELLDRLGQRGASLLVETMNDLANGSASAVPQDQLGITTAPKLHSSDAQLLWANPAFLLDRIIRACQPDPGAWTMFRGERVKVQRARIIDDVNVQPGSLVVSKHSLSVATSNGALELLEVQPHGKKAMSAADWARGARIESGERFE